MDDLGQADVVIVAKRTETGFGVASDDIGQFTNAIDHVLIHFLVDLTDKGFNRFDRDRGKKFRITAPTLDPASPMTPDTPTMSGPFPLR